MREPEAAVAIVHTPGPDESVLLIRRTERADDPWSGHWSFPGGRRDPLDIDLLETALRELREECGVRLLREDLEMEMPTRFAGRRLGAHIPVTPYLFRVNEELALIPDPREAAEAVWVPLNLLRDPSRHVSVPIPGMPPEARFGAVSMISYPLWGFTYKLICDWLNIMPRQD
jgi:8-oxo-dGTP pyrophosphatase MutT (NUDIX family)